ncbi:DNA polymerase III subunit delta [Candidatus Nitrospira bockiana]
MKPFELDQAIKKSGLAPIYLVLGEEDDLRDQAVATIKAAAMQEGDLGDFNIDVVYGDESDGAEIVARAGEVPVFAPRRLVFVKAADKLSARDGEALVPYLKAPSESTTLVFVAPKLDGRTALTQALKQAAVVVDCGPLPDAQLPSWIRAEAAKVRLRLDEPAVVLLKDLAATSSLSLIKRELEKLAAYVADGRVAGVAEVEALRGSEAGASVFDLTAAIGAGNKMRVLRILTRNLESGEAPLRILGSLIWQYRQLWKAKDAARTGREGEAARLLRVPPFKLRAFLAPFTDAHLQTAFRRFAELDSKLKGGSANDPRVLLDALGIELCGLAQAPKPKPTSTRPPVGAGQVPARPGARTIRPGRS